MSDSSIKPIRLAVLISGGGTTLRNLVRSIKDDGLPATIELVISSNPKSAGLSCAAQDEIPTLTCRRQAHYLAVECPHRAMMSMKWSGRQLGISESTGSS